MEKHLENGVPTKGEPIQLKDNWCIWERYHCKTYKKQDRKLVTLSTLQDLAQVFKYTQYCKPSNFFYDTENQKLRKVRD
jgi:Cu2+-containing amine oxidase